MFYFEFLPDELVNIIMEYTISDAKKLIRFNPRYQKLYDNLVKGVKEGKIKPNLIFDKEYRWHTHDFKYPFDSLLNGIGSFDINSTRNGTNIEEFRNFLNETPDEIYYLQEGRNDGESWIFVVKKGDVYYSFEASCDYTGFDCRGGGSFGYSKNWNTLWNYYMSGNVRNIMLLIYGFETFSIVKNLIDPSDINYIESSIIPEDMGNVSISGFLDNNQPYHK
jgi:hypothetical protein